MTHKDGPNEFRVLIVGGGIAGLATATALRAPGRHITVLERSRMLRETGALLSLQPNASKLVTRWGLDPTLQRLAEPQADESLRIFNTDGELVREIPLVASTFGAGRTLYHRQDLHSALRETATREAGAHESELFAAPPAEIITGTEVVACDVDEGAVTLGSGEVLRADVIIGADGIKSVIRSAVTGEASKAQLTGLSAYRILIPADKLDALPPGTLPVGVLKLKDPAATTMIMGHDKRVIMGPGRGGKVLGITALVPDESMHEQPDDDSWISPGSKQELIEAYADFPPWLHAVLQQAPDDEIGPWQLRDIKPLATWTKGRVILIGDAAHAMLPTQGQGASQAIEDAEALQAFLVEFHQTPATKQQVEDALRKVFEARHERASLIQAYSREQARPDAGGKKKMNLDPGEFMEFNCNYNGAIDWLKARAGEKHS